MAHTSVQNGLLRIGFHDAPCYSEAIGKYTLKHLTVSEPGGKTVLSYVATDPDERGMGSVVLTDAKTVPTLTDPSYVLLWSESSGWLIGRRQASPLESAPDVIDWFEQDRAERLAADGKSRPLSQSLFEEALSELLKPDEADE